MPLRMRDKESRAQAVPLPENPSARPAIVVPRYGQERTTEPRPKGDDANAAAHSLWHWAGTTAVFVAQAHDILHFNTLSGELSEVMKPMQDKGKLATGRLQISTMCVHKSVCIAGGFYGDMVCVRCPGAKGSRPEVLFSERITSDENAITNSIVTWEPPSGSLRAVIANNDCVMRVMDVDSHFTEVQRALFDWPVNFTAISPDGKLACVVGDATDAVRRFRHDGLKTFGVGKDRSKNEWRSLLRQIYAAGLVNLEIAEYGRWTITERGDAV